MVTQLISINGVTQLMGGVYFELPDCKAAEDCYNSISSALQIGIDEQCSCCVPLVGDASCTVRSAQYINISSNVHETTGS